MKLLYSSFFILFTFICFAGAIFPQPWTSIESGSLNINTALGVYDVRLESLNGKIYAAWIENGNIRMKRYDGGTTWTLVDEGGKAWCDHRACNNLATTVYNNAIYMVWWEVDPDSCRRIHAMRYDGTNWTFVQSYTPGVLNDGRYYISQHPTGYSRYPSIGVHNGKLYASWIEQTDTSFNFQVRVSEFDGTYWKFVDGGNPNHGLNRKYGGLFNRDFPYISMASYAGNLYVAWREFSTVNSQFQLRVKRYDGGSSWTFVDGGAQETGLNYFPLINSIQQQPKLISYNGYLYVFFTEQTFYSAFQGLNLLQLRWKRYNGSGWSNDDATPQDATTTAGWNKSPDFQSNDPVVVADAGKIYTSWSEVTEVTTDNYYEQIHLVDFDGTAKTFIDGGLNTGINYNTSTDARLTALLIHEGDLYTGWQELNTGTYRYNFRVKKYTLPPVINSVTVPANASYIADQQLDFTVSFSKIVNVAGGTPYIPITLNTGGTVNANYISGSGTKSLLFRYTVADGNEDNNGISVGSAITLPGGCTLKSSDASPLNASLTLHSVGSTSSVLVDAVSPNVISINRQNPLSSSTNAASVVFRVTFNENVSGVDISDFSLTKTETANGTIASVSSASGTTIDVTVNAISGYGTFRLDLKSSGTGITDNASNPISGGFTGGQTYETPNAAITFSDGSDFSQSITCGSINQIIGRFQLSTDVSGSFLNSVTIKLNGTRSGLTNLKLWSSTDGSFDSGTDPQLGANIDADPGDGNTASFGSLSSAISTSCTYYFITGDVSASATGSVQGEIVQNSDLTFIHGTLSGTITNALLSGSTAPLPVELSSFTANTVSTGVELKWTTATEQNNYGFEIQHSFPTLDKEGAGGGWITPGQGGNTPLNPLSRGDERGMWEKIGFVEGHGTINSPNEYSFIDTEVSSQIGNVQYRLKQIDLDGNYKYYSQIAEVNFSMTDVKEKQSPTEFGLSQNYPNPFNPSTVISYQLPVTSQVVLKVYDMLGKEVAALVNETKAPGYHTVEFNANDLAAGVYIYQLRTNSFVSSKKLLLLK